MVQKLIDLFLSLAAKLESWLVNIEPDLQPEDIPFAPGPTVRFTYEETEDILTLEIVRDGGNKISMLKDYPEESLGMFFWEFLDNEELHDLHNLEYEYKGDDPELTRSKSMSWLMRSLYTQRLYEVLSDQKVTGHIHTIEDETIICLSVETEDDSPQIRVKLHDYHMQEMNYFLPEGFWETEEDEALWMTRLMDVSTLN